MNHQQDIDSRRAALGREWETMMQLRYDVMPAWYWNRSERDAERDAWVSARLEQEANHA